MDPDLRVQSQANGTDILVVWALEPNLEMHINESEQNMQLGSRERG